MRLGLKAIALIEKLIELSLSLAATFGVPLLIAVILTQTFVAGSLSGS